VLLACCVALSVSLPLFAFFTELIEYLADVSRQSPAWDSKASAVHPYQAVGNVRPTALLVQAIFYRNDVGRTSFVGLLVLDTCDHGQSRSFCNDEGGAYTMRGRSIEGGHIRTRLGYSHTSFDRTAGLLLARRWSVSVECLGSPS
jgi:hypothetical protein